MAKEVSASKAVLIEEREGEQIVWAIREEPDVLMLGGMELINIERRSLKLYLVAWATGVADEFWATHHRRRIGDGVYKEYGEYGVRVIERANLPQHLGSSACASVYRFGPSL